MTRCWAKIRAHHLPYDERLDFYDSPPLPPPLYLYKLVFTWNVILAALLTCAVVSTLVSSHT